MQCWPLVGGERVCYYCALFSKIFVSFFILFSAVFGELKVYNSSELRTAILSSPKVVRTLMPITTPFLPPSPDCRPFRHIWLRTPLLGEEFTWRMFISRILYATYGNDAFSVIRNVEKERNYDATRHEVRFASKRVCGPWAPPGGGAYSAPPDPLAEFGRGG